MAVPDAQGRIELEAVTDFSGGIINVLVGKDKKLYPVHESVLRSNSEFVDAVLEKCWAEGQTKKIELPVLPEDDTEWFNAYVQYLYSGSIACKGVSISDEYSRLANLYGVGERLDDEDFKDTVLGTILSTLNEEQHTRYPEEELDRVYPGADAINRIYMFTAEGSPARQLMVDIYVRDSHADFYWGPQNDDKQLPHDFLLDLVEAYAAKRELKEEFQEELKDKIVGTDCAYHHHDEDEPCAAKRRKLS